MARERDNRVVIEKETANFKFRPIIKLGNCSTESGLGACGWRAGLPRSDAGCECEHASQQNTRHPFLIHKRLLAIAAAEAAGSQGSLHQIEQCRSVPARPTLHGALAWVRATRRGGLANRRPTGPQAKE